jgi:hypothetical protein
MSFLREIKGWLGLDPDRVTSPSDVSREDPLFVYVKLPGDIPPLDRAADFEDPLTEVLEASGVGSITGGGSQLSDPDESGARHVEFAGIDVDLYDPFAGLDLLVRELRRLGAPQGTVLLYELDGQDRERKVHEP